MITIKPFDGEFANDIPPFIGNIQRGEFNIPITLEQQPDLFDIARAYQQRGKGNFWVASVAPLGSFSLRRDQTNNTAPLGSATLRRTETNGELIGTIALIDAGEGIAILRKMFVRKDWRGRPERVAQQLLNHLTLWAKQHDFRKIYLGTVDVLAAAQRFYEKNGFSVFPEDQLPPHIVKMPDDNTYYAMELAA
jgi:GNAT superfamily N-acetyltransferase